MLDQIKRHLAAHLSAWLIPTVVIGTLGSVYALVRPNTWCASQAFLVRDEAMGELGRTGRFDTAEARKAAQETIIQVARNRTVVRSALEQLRPADRPTQSWPTEKDIQTVQSGINVTAPKGAEFGQTDVIYLQVKARSASESVALNRALFGQLSLHLQELRDRRADSVISELSEKLKLTQANWNTATSALEAMEREVGSDLGELRTMNQSGAGESNLRTSLNSIKADLRAAQASHTALQQQLELLLAAHNEPEKLVATPNAILETQPALRRLKDGLIDAQLRVAELLGRMNEDHPAVKAAMIAEAEIRQHMHAELTTSIRGIRAEMKVSDAVINSMKNQLAEVQQRLDRLASVRARYSNLVDEVQHRSEEVKEAQRALAEARAIKEAAGTASLIDRVDQPDPGDGPVGPSRLVIIGAAWIGGFMTGVGLLLVTVNPAAGRTGRRWTDRLAVPFGRRSTDHAPPAGAAPRRRASDRAMPDPHPDGPSDRSS
jgi:uncharacterized protein involved in exopolysaccharide biosynthesis